MRWHIVSSRSVVGLLAITTVLSVTPMAFGGTGPLAGGVVLQAEPEPDPDPDPDPDPGDGCPSPLGLTFVDQVGDVCNYTYETTDFVDATATTTERERCG